MSYSSRVYRQRNAHGHDEGKKDAFFDKQNDAANEHDANSFFQTKLDVNEPGDKHEKEADAAADAVVNKTSQKPVTATEKITGVQRLSTSAEDEKLGTNDARMQKDKEIQEKPMGQPDKEKDKKVQKKGPAKEDKEKEKLKGLQKKDDPAKEEEKKKPGQVQKKGEAGTGMSSGLSTRIEDAAGKGEALPGKTLQEMNNSFGVSFEDVRIHKNSEAADMNQELQARAFTHGKDIYFNEGKFDPDSLAGKFLLAHELTHVIQQTGSSDSSKNQRVGSVSAAPVSETTEEKDDDEIKKDPGQANS